MTTHYNDLSPGDTERLAILAEECGEVVQSIGKILRHGAEDVNPTGSGGDNRAMLECEIGDLLCAVDMLFDCGFLDRQAIDFNCEMKHNSVARWFHFDKPRRQGE